MLVHPDRLKDVYVGLLPPWVIMSIFVSVEVDTLNRVAMSKSLPPVRHVPFREKCRFTDLLARVRRIVLGSGKATPRFGAFFTCQVGYSHHDLAGSRVSLPLLEDGRVTLLPGSENHRSRISHFTVWFMDKTRESLRCTRKKATENAKCARINSNTASR